MMVQYMIQYNKHSQLYKIQLLLLFKVIINRSIVEPVYDTTNASITKVNSN